MRTFAGKGALQGQLRRFADGDTVFCLIELLWGVWTEKYVRLPGVESWELDGPDRAKAVHARDQLNQLYAGVSCQIIPAKWGLDPYGRVIAQVIIEHGNLGDQIIELGLGWPYKKDPNHRNRGPMVVLPRENAPGCPQIDSDREGG